MSSSGSPNPLVPGFRWRFATVTPSEGLLRLPVLLGVTRCLYMSQTAPDPASRFQELLAELQGTLGESCTVNLVRTRERDLLRNSGQYWSVLGLIENRQPTPLGEGVAVGRLSPRDFVSRSISAFTIPNRLYDNETSNLLAGHGILIRPLALILETISALRSLGSPPQISLTEMQAVLVPGSCAKLSVADLAGLILARRSFPTRFHDDFGDYRDNDRRTLREFGLYLCNVGLLEHRSTEDDDVFAAVSDFESTAFTSAGAVGLLTTAGPSRDIEIGPDTIERAINQVRRRARPNQAVFRRRVFELCGGKCVISGESLSSTLEAAHLRSVEEGGSDHHSNGIVLRADLHRLFDDGHLRVDAEGKVHLSPEARASVTYSALPTQIVLPAHVDQRQVAHRFMTGF
jgi:hypothetical protein